MSTVEQTNKKFLNIIVIISAIILLTIIVLAILGVFNRDNRTDEEKLVDAAIQTALSDSKIIDMIITIEDLDIEGLDGMNAQVMERVIKDLDLEIQVQEDGPANTMFISFSLGMNGISILSGDLFVSESVVAISIPTLYDKVIYANIENLKNIHGDMMDMPMMNDSQKADHEEVFADIESKLLEGDYEAIEQFNFIGYYDVITAFIESIKTEEMMVERDDDVELMHYQLSSDIPTMLSIIGDMKAVFDEDLALQALIEDHKVEMSDMGGEMPDNMMGEFSLDQSLNGLDDITMTSDIYVNEDERIESSYTMVAFPLNGIAGLLDYPLEVLIGVESSIAISEASLYLEVPDLEGGVDISSMTEEEMSIFLDELLESVSSNLSENQLFQMMGIDAESLLENLMN